LNFISISLEYVNDFQKINYCENIVYSKRSAGMFFIGDTFDGHFPIFIETRDLKISESPDLNLEESSNSPIRAPMAWVRKIFKSKFPSEKKSDKNFL
jgi:hypothetical protein